MIPTKPSFYLKETSSLVQTACTHGPSWRFLQWGSTACLGLLKVETFLMVSPACRKFLSKPQNTHNNSPAKIFFRQQHSAIYFPPKPFHLLSGWFPASDSTVPRLCPTSLSHLPLLQLTQVSDCFVFAWPHTQVLKGPMLDITIICSKGYSVNVAGHRGTAEEWGDACPRKSCWNGMRSSLALLALSPRQGQHKGTGN